MLFKNLSIYRLPPDFNDAPAELEARLADRCLFPCAPFEMKSRGWVNASPAQRLLHSIESHRLVSLGTEEKLLPTSIIRQVASERAVIAAEKQGFPVGRKQLRDLRIQVGEELKARALCRRRETRAWIDAANGWFVVDAASAPRCEDVIETLRASLGSFAVVPLATERSPAAVMSAWLTHGQAPAPFSIDDNLELRAADKSPAVIRYGHCAAEEKELRTRLASGMQPTRLGLTWHGRVSFVLTDKLAIKQLEFVEVESSEDDVADDVDPVERFDAELLLMGGELNQLLADLVQVLGGEARLPAVAAAAA
jgi:recombination associated protein RdgC